MSDERKEKNSSNDLGLEIEDLDSPDEKKEITAADEQPEPKIPEDKAEVKNPDPNEPEIEEVNLESPEEKPKKKRGPWVKILVFGVIAAAGFFIWYFYSSVKYETVFFPNTTVNGVNVSGLDSETAKNMINDQVKDYFLSVKARDFPDQNLSGADIGLEYSFDDTLDHVIKKQNPFLWILHNNKEIDYKIDTIARTDDAKFNAAVDKLSCMDKSSFSTPADARVSDYREGTGYTVIPEIRGNVLDTVRAKELIKKAVLELQQSLDLNAAQPDLYQEAEIKSDDQTLNTTCKNLNAYVLTEIRYPDVPGIVLNGSVIKDWLTVGSDLTVSLNHDAVVEWVKNLAKQLDTVYQAKNLHTSWGTDVKITGGSYGWKMDQTAEIKYLDETLPTGQKLERSPAYTRTAASHGQNDYGDTYVEINLTMQHLYYYKNGSLVVDSDFVSGCTSKGRGTPTGIYQVSYKQRKAVLRGQGYASPVDYWMPFNAGVGLHDADWRSEFGGNIYKSSGSHGCINLPYSAAKTIFNHIEPGCPVLVYNMDGSVSGPTTKEAKEEQLETPEITTETVAETAAETTVAAPTETKANVVSPKGPGVTQSTSEETSAVTDTPRETGISGGPGYVSPKGNSGESSAAVPGPGN